MIANTKLLKFITHNTLYLTLDWKLILNLNTILDSCLCKKYIEIVTINKAFQTSRFVKLHIEGYISTGGNYLTVFPSIIILFPSFPSY